ADSAADRGDLRRRRAWARRPYLDDRAAPGRAHDPDHSNQAPPDQDVDRDRDQRLGLQNVVAGATRLEDPPEGGDERPGDPVDEADEVGLVAGAEQLHEEADRDQRADHRVHEPDHALEARVIAADHGAARVVVGRRRVHRRHGRANGGIYAGIARDRFAVDALPALFLDWSHRHENLQLLGLAMKTAL